MKVVELKPQGPNKDFIDSLKELVELAEKGDLIGYVLLATRSDDSGTFAVQGDISFGQACVAWEHFKMDFCFGEMP